MKRGHLVFGFFFAVTKTTLGWVQGGGNPYEAYPGNPYLSQQPAQQQNIQQQEQQNNANEVIITRTVTENRNQQVQHRTTLMTTRTLYMVPRGAMMPGQPLDPNRPQGTTPCTTATETIHETDYIVHRFTETATVAPHTINVPLTRTITKVSLQWQTVPVELRVYQTVTATETARPMIADLIPQILPNNGQMPNSRVVSDPWATANSNPGQPVIPFNVPTATPTFGPIAGQMVLDLPRISTATVTTTSSETIVSVIKSPCDWNEMTPLSMTSCDVCRQQCADLTSGCCQMECAGQMPQQQQQQRDAMGNSNNRTPINNNNNQANRNNNAPTNTQFRPTTTASVSVPPGMVNPAGNIPVAPMGAMNAPPIAIPPPPQPPGMPFDPEDLPCDHPLLM